MDICLDQSPVREYPSSQSLIREGGKVPLKQNRLQPGVEFIRAVQNSELKDSAKKSQTNSSQWKH